MDPYLTLKVVLIATFSLLKRSESVSILISFNAILTMTLNGYNFFLFSCHILTKKKQRMYRTTAKLSDFNIMAHHCRWLPNDVTVTCTYHFDNGIVLTVHLKFGINRWFECFSTFIARISNGFPLVNQLYRKVDKSILFLTLYHG